MAAPWQLPHGLGIRNEWNDVLVEWYEEKELIVTNAWFKQHKCLLFIWKSPDEQTRNKINYVLVNQLFRNIVRSCMTFPGTDSNSDHNLLMANMICKMTILNFRIFYILNKMFFKINY